VEKHAEIPTHVINMIHSMPRTTHPMTLFSQAIMALQVDSVFSRRYTEGLSKSDYWIPTLDDSIRLTAKLPALAAIIYNWKYRDGSILAPDPDLDWSGNFAYMIENPNNHEYEELCRLFFLLHSDHEGGNVSAHTAHLVNSALSDIYLTSAAAMIGWMARALFGQPECLRWLLGCITTSNPFLQRGMANFARQNCIRAGDSGTGTRFCAHDPRFSPVDFAKKYLPDDEFFHSFAGSMKFSLMFSRKRERSRIRIPTGMPSMERCSIITVLENLIFTRFCLVYRVYWELPRMPSGRAH
jgi:citrate synthase